jgi:ATP-dependent Zn protease
MSEQFRFQVDSEVQRILKESYERVKGLLERN